MEQQEDEKVHAKLFLSKKEHLSIPTEINR